MPHEFIPDVTLYIVDDDEAARQSMVDLFATGCGYRVQAFASGEEFLRRANLKKPDCLLLDRRMDDGISGLQVHDAVVAQSSPIVVIFLSGHGDIPTSQEARDKGAFAWMVKGMDTNKLKAKVAAAMTEAQARTLHQFKRSEVMARWRELSPRKMEAARLIRTGWANRLVADEMKIGTRVAERYRSDVFETLWVNNPTELDRLMRDYAID